MREPIPFPSQPIRHRARVRIEWRQIVFTAALTAVVVSAGWALAWWLL